MKGLTEEKVLYHAFHNGSFTIQSYEYKGNTQKVIDSLLKCKFITWETNGIWQDYKSSGSEEYYDSAWHNYKITETGEVRLLIYRLVYAYKNHKDSDKHQRRIDELNQTLERYKLDINNFRNNCSKNEIKAINDFNNKVLIQRTSFVELTEAGDYVELSPYNIDPNWGRTFTNIDDSTSTINNNNINDIDFSDPVLNNMFQMSTMLGEKGYDSSRTDDYVLRKINEELGEMTLEMNIRDGLSYKEAGKDGVKGEAVDLAICALDMFALQCPGMSADEIEREFLTYMCTKLHKWRKSIQ